MRVPVTDAFDDSDDLESLEVELTTRQLDWLRKTADERDLSLGHVLRSVITAQMRSQGEEGKASASAVSEREQASAFNDADGETDDDPPSIVDSLRSASERLQDLTEQDDAAETPDPHDTLERLQARLGNSEANEDTEEDQESFLVENQNRSMFDMMEEDEA